MSKKALIAMSGGVDSSVAAKMTIDMGYECIGCTMRLYDIDDEESDIIRENSCCSLSDVEDARSVSYRMGMPYYVFNFKDEFEEKVIKNFVNSYLNARTPNPCIDCNQYMKFDKLYDRAVVMGCDYVVTGHYARIEQDDATGKYKLLKAIDDSKDQSYVLYRMSQQQLAHTLFPLGGLTKDETRKIASENGFINANKPDSQDICFVPDGDYAATIEKYTGIVPKKGDFTDKDGKVLGEHKGIIHYTIGQRKGLGVSADRPLYVCSICPENNTVVLGDNADLFGCDLKAEDINWIEGELPDKEIRCSARIRYHHKEQPGVMKPIDKNSFEFHFDEPQRAITPGQSIVLYDGDVVLGGGIIS